MQDSSGKPIQQNSNEMYENDCAKLKYCLDIGKCAYEQEKTRYESIKSRSENILKYSTLFIAIVNLVVALVDRGVFGVDLNELVKTLYVILMITIIFSIILALIAQRPIFAEMFPDGVWMFNEIKEHPEQYECEMDCIYDMILRYTSSTEALRKTNDTSFIYVVISYCLYVISIGLLTWILAITVSI
ncbi:MAG: hypothetical protein NC321_11140 [Clostridium sp.]|nr:hypothetical protein [Clostridium sp.]